MTEHEEFCLWYADTIHAKLSRQDPPRGRHRYRYEGTYRQWVGKPDPSGHGRYARSGNDRSELERQRRIDLEFGHKPGEIFEDKP